MKYAIVSSYNYDEVFALTEQHYCDLMAARTVFMEALATHARSTPCPSNHVK